jgi:hypothetical protein
MKKFAFLFVVAAIFASCGTSTPKQQEEVVIEQEVTSVDSLSQVVDSLSEVVAEVEAVVAE